MTSAYWRRQRERVEISPRIKKQPINNADSVTIPNIGTMVNSKSNQYRLLNGYKNRSIGRRIFLKSWKFFDFVHWLDFELIVRHNDDDYATAVTTSKSRQRCGRSAATSDVYTIRTAKRTRFSMVNYLCIFPLCFFLSEREFTRCNNSLWMANGTVIVVHEMRNKVRPAVEQADERGGHGEEEESSRVRNWPRRYV